MRMWRAHNRTGTLGTQRHNRSHAERPHMDKQPPPPTLEGMHNCTGTLGTQRNNRTRTQHSHGWTNNPHTDAQPHANT